MADVPSLRDAIAKLYSLPQHTQVGVQKEAEQVLLTWRNSANSELFCLKALQQLVWGGLSSHEAFFFASSLRATCCKSSVDVIKGLLPETVRTLVHLIACQADSSAYCQVAGAVAVVAVRCWKWGAEGRDSSALGELLRLHQQAAVQMLAQEPQRIESVALNASMEVLLALPAAATATTVSLHPDKRTNAQLALACSPHVLPFIQSGLNMGSERAMSMCISIIQNWCQELGVAPQGLEREEGIVRSLCQLVFNESLATVAADCMTAIFNTCRCQPVAPVPVSANITKPPSSPAKGPASDSSAAAQQLLTSAASVQHNKAALRRLALRQWLGSLKEVPLNSRRGYNLHEHVKLAVCCVSCAAGAAALGPVLQSGGHIGQQQQQQQQQPQPPPPQLYPPHASEPQGRTSSSGAGHKQCDQVLDDFMYLAEHLLEQLGQSNEVALEAASFWTEVYVATLESLPVTSSSSSQLPAQHAGRGRPQEHEQAGSSDQGSSSCLDRGAMLSSLHHVTLLQHLASRLVWRTQLSPEDASVASADARDVPEEARMLRRELASALRNISSLVGPVAMIRHVAGLVQQALQQFLDHSAASPGEGNSRKGSASLADASCLEAGSCLGSGTGWSAPGVEWTPLESALYASNCVLNKMEGNLMGQLPDAESQVLIDACTASIVHPSGSLKLSGTSLTLLGGIAPFYVQHPSGRAALPSVLNSILHSLNSTDPKLSRNAATTLQRLCQCPGLGSLLLSQHVGWVEQVLVTYGARGGMRQRAGDHEDSSTEELLLSTLCKLASLAGGAATNLILQLAAQQVLELARSLSELADFRVSDTVLLPLSVAPPLHPGMTGCSALSGVLSASSPFLAQLCQHELSHGGRTSSLAPTSTIIQRCCNSLRSLCMVAESVEVQSMGAADNTANAGSTSVLDRCSVQHQLLELVQAVTSMISFLVTYRPCWLHVAQAAPLYHDTGSFLAAALKKMEPEPLLCLETLQLSLNMLDLFPPEVFQSTGGSTLLSSCMEMFMHRVQVLLMPGGMPAEAQPGSLDLGSVVADVGGRICHLGHCTISGASAAVLELKAPPGPMGGGTDLEDAGLAALIRLASAAVTHMPVCLQPHKSDAQSGNLALDILILATARAAYSSDPELCRLVLEWVDLLCCAPFQASDQSSAPMSHESEAKQSKQQHEVGSRRTSSSKPSRRGGGSGAKHWSHATSEHRTPPSQMAGAAQLREYLDSGGGAKVLLTLLCAASGSMPPNMLLPISCTLHKIWMCLGTQRLGTWLQMAIMSDMLPLTAPLSPHRPWRLLSTEAKVEFLHELLSQGCMVDTSRFKKHLKNFCGGKKKGGAGVGSAGASWEGGFKRVGSGYSMGGSPSPAHSHVSMGS